jgi:hypothetical protein
MYCPLIMDQHLLPEVLRSVPVTRHTKSSVTEQRNTKSEITKLQAQCEQLNLELAKVRSGQSGMVAGELKVNVCVFELGP